MLPSCRHVRAFAGYPQCRGANPPPTSKMSYDLMRSLDLLIENNHRARLIFDHNGKAVFRQFASAELGFSRRVEIAHRVLGGRVEPAGISRTVKRFSRNAMIENGFAYGARQMTLLSWPSITREAPGIV